MSDACHANTSTIAHRKVTSASSYLSSRVELMVKAPPVPSSLTETFLVPDGVALDFLFLSVELSGTSSTGALHSEEVRLLEWVREVLRVREVLPVFFFPPGASAAGASESTHILDSHGRLNLLDSLDLVWVCLDPTL